MEKSGLVVSKFGGSSLASAAQIRKVGRIIRADARRRVVVVSAPGKDEARFAKVTDELIQLWRCRKNPDSWWVIWTGVKNRFVDIVDGLGLKLDLRPQFVKIERRIPSASFDYLVSRGEYLCALVMAEYLGYAFVDAEEVVHFAASGQVDEAVTYHSIRDRCKGTGGYVIPGFYGRRHISWWFVFLSMLGLPSLATRVKVFPRNGSDISGAIAATALGAEAYEIWSDSPMRSADPRVVMGPTIVQEITFRELRELAYGGASVVHADAVEPCRKQAIPIRLLDTNTPSEAGTCVVSERVCKETVVGIAGRKGFVQFGLTMPGLHDQLGLAAKALDVFRYSGVSVEHMPTGIDTMSIVAHQNSIGQQALRIQGDLQFLTPHDPLQVTHGIALVSVVGLGMVNKPGVLADITAALADAEINILMVTQDPRQTSVIIGVSEEHMDDVIRRLYWKFFLRKQGGK